MKQYAIKTILSEYEVQSYRTVHTSLLPLSFVLTYFKRGIPENKNAFTCASFNPIPGQKPEGFMLNAVASVPCKLPLP